MSYFIQIWKSNSAQADDCCALLFHRIWLVAGIGLGLIATMAWTALLAVRPLRATPKQAKMHIDIKMATTAQRPFFCVVLPALGKVASGPLVGLAKAMIEPPQNMYA